MTFSYFFTKLGFFTIGMIFLLGGLYFVPGIGSHSLLSAVSLAVFVVLSAGLFFPFRNAALSTNKSLFTSLSMAFILFKLLLSVIIILLYNKYAQPSDNLFLVPFALIYIGYTVFETWTMGVLGRMKRRDER